MDTQCVSGSGQGYELGLELTMPPGTNADYYHFAASIVLAFCDMATLYLRNVPDVVVDRLQRLAAREGASVNAIAVRELTESSKRADNPALLGALPDLAVDAKTIVADMEAERSRR